MTFEEWDALADAVNPCMAVTVLLLPWLTKSTRQLSRTTFYVAAFANVALVYLIGFIDRLSSMWGRFGLDFSTHTGVAVALVMSSMLWQSRGWVGFFVVAAYIQLMLAQGYHTGADIVTTAIVVVVGCALTHVAVWRFREQRSGSRQPRSRSAHHQ